MSVEQRPQPIAALASQMRGLMSLAAIEAGIWQRIWVPYGSMSASRD